VAVALEYAHNRGVVHRDVKPENVLLAGRTAVVTDFGIAKAVSAARDGGSGSVAALTQLGIALGTAAYMAPEQAAGDPDVDHRADLYAWGMLAYELLAGRHPFADKVTAQALLVAQFVERPTPLAELHPDLHAALAAVVMRCLEKEPAQRPGSADELLAALSTPPAASPVTSTARPAVPARPVERSLAVLPFENLSPDPDNAFLADGLAEEVITDLARVRALRVMARSSVLHYRASTKTPREVGRELGAAYLLTGSVRRHGAALRVSVQLVEVERDAQLWAERFSGTIEDVFEIQERIAREIVAALEVRLSPEESRRLAAHSIRNAAAYELYLRARQSDFEFDRDTIAAGLRLLDQADAIEGERAPLLAARALLVWNEFNMRMRGEDAYAEVRALADRALALDPSLAPALVARAMLEYGAEHMDAALMLRLLQRAVEEERAPAALTHLTVILGQAGRTSRCATRAWPSSSIHSRSSRRARRRSRCSSPVRWTRRWPSACGCCRTRQITKSSASSSGRSWRVADAPPRRRACSGRAPRRASTARSRSGCAARWPAMRRAWTRSSPTTRCRRRPPGTTSIAGLSRRHSRSSDGTTPRWRGCDGAPSARS
jgi:TolB-like protein